MSTATRAGPERAGTGRPGPAVPVPAAGRRPCCTAGPACAGPACSRPRWPGWACSTSSRSGFLLATAFFDTDSFTGRITYTLTPDNVVEVLTDPAYLLTAARTIGVAVGVTVLCVLLALPLATYMALVARPRARPVLVALVLTPLWASLPGQGVRLADPAGRRWPAGRSG